MEVAPIKSLKGKGREGIPCMFAVLGMCYWLC